MNFGKHIIQSITGSSNTHFPDSQIEVLTSSGLLETYSCLFCYFAAIIPLHPSPQIYMRKSNGWTSKENGEAGNWRTVFVVQSSSPPFLWVGEGWRAYFLYPMSAIPRDSLAQIGWAYEKRSLPTPPLTGHLQSLPWGFPVEESQAR